MPQLTQQEQVRERTTDRDRQRVELDRLDDEVIGAGPDRADGIVERAMPGDHDGEDVGVALPDLLAQLEPVEIRHVNVGDDHVDRVGRQPTEARRR
jgi:hypothetical protein